MTLQDLTKNYTGEIIVYNSEPNSDEVKEKICICYGGSVLLDVIGTWEVVEWVTQKHGTTLGISVWVKIPITI